MNDFLPPNIHQFAPTWEDGKLEKRFQRPMITIWAVPVDDTHTMTLGFRHFNERMTDEERARMRSQKNSLESDGFGQTGDRPYEDKQRQPGDYEAQVGQRPIAIHTLEHLGTTDRGIVMLRRMVRDGIRAVQNGEDPKRLDRREGKILLTYSSDTIIQIPRRGDREADERLLLETGRKVIHEYLDHHPASAAALTEA